MKSKFSRILGVGLTMAVLASMLVVANPAAVSAGTLSWGPPSESTPGVVGNVIAPAGTDIVDLAVAADGKTIYAALGTGDLSSTVVGPQALAKSTDGGATWSSVGIPADNVTGSTTTIQTSVNKVVVAPDDANIIMIVADGNEIYISLNGATTWNNTNPPGATALKGIDISKLIGTARVYGAAGEKAGPLAAAWILDLGSFGGAWTDTTVGAGPAPAWDNAGFDTTASIAWSIKFSPQYPGDRSFAVVTGNAANLNVKVQLASNATKKWNASAFPGFGGAVADPKGVIVVGTGGNAIAAASLAMPASFFAGDSTARVAYVGVSSNATGVAEGLFRIGDAGATALSSAGMQSVALNAAGDKLVAGAAESNNVLRSSSPATASSVAGMASATGVKRPGETNGVVTTNMIVVAFAGTNVVAGSSGPESAFSISRDEGKSFNDISLIDNGTTTTPIIKDVAVNADGTKLYLVTTDSSGMFTSLWKKVTAWEKVWSAGSTTALTTNYIVRPAPENFDVIYVAFVGGTDFWYSNDAGEASWTSRISAGVVADVAVESAAVIYALTPAGSVSKSLDSGFLWDNPLSVTGVTGGHMIASISKDNLVVGGTAGDAAFSTNGNTSWTKINAPSGVSGNTHITASGLASGNFIYAVLDTTSSGVYKYTVGTSTSFSNMLGTSALTAVGGAKGIALNSGALYILASDGTNSVLRRTLTPSTATSLDNFNTTDSVAKNYTAQVQALKSSVGADKSPKLWTINVSATGGSLDSFTDTLAAAGPTMTGPAANATVDVNPASGSAVAVPFTWTRLSLATKYDLQIALDSNFTQVVLSFTAAGGNPVSSSDTNVVQLVTPLAGSFQPDVTYYWRVRVSPNGPMDSPYSAARTFKVASLRPLTLQAPATGAPSVTVNPTFVWSPVTGATTYELVVSDDPTFAIITFSRTTSQPVFASDEQLAYDTVYYWRVRASAPASAVTPFATGIFTTEPRPVAPTTAPPPVTVTQTSVTVTVPAGDSVEIIPPWMLWIIIGIGAILVIALIVLIARTRRVG